MLGLYSLFDKKVNNWYAPFGVERNNVVPMLLHLMSGDGSIFGKYPEDFDVYTVGTFNPKSGEVVPSTPEYIGGLKDIEKIWKETENV